ncbi:MAG: hypothetical protein JWQ27_3137 [Ferruginibacter sp.]|nr:hypothetical protein [Ferruginibacter sp.]
MNNENVTGDSLHMSEFNKPVLPQTLNILTILTFIGCSLLALFTLATPWFMKFSKNMMEKANSSDMTPKQLEDMRKGAEQIAKTEQNMVPIIAMSLVGIGLCFAGAYMMRKLKKDGYWLYLAGQAIPLIGGLVIMGTDQYGDWKAYIGLAIVALFVALYTSQKKYLVN